jgi:hypothetical protein
LQLPVDVHGELCIDSPSGALIALQADGAQLRLTVPRWADLQQFGPRALLGQRRAIVTAIRALRTSNLTLNISVGGRHAAGFGAGVKTTMLARLLGLASADIRLSTIVNFLRARAAAA